MKPNFSGKWTTPLTERFWACVNKGPSCWIWTGNKTAVYGRIRIHNVATPAHRASWVLHYGPIPAGVLVLHKCDNPLCVRPDHLELGTQHKNISDAVKRKRHSSCRTGPDHNAAKLTTDQVIQVLTWEPAHGTLRALADQLGVSSGTLGAIRRGERYKTIYREYRNAPTLP